MIRVERLKADSGTIWTYVAMDQYDAFLLIENLSRQMRTGDPNTCRPEFRTKSGERLTLFVENDTTSGKQNGADG